MLQDEYGFAVPSGLSSVRQSPLPDPHTYVPLDPADILVCNPGPDDLRVPPTT